MASHSIRIEPVPLMQAILHAAKYPDLPVCGLFLGSKQTKKEKNKKKKEDGEHDEPLSTTPSEQMEKENKRPTTTLPHTLAISACIPLLHSTLSLPMLLEIAVDQVRLFLRELHPPSSSHPALEVVAFYYACDTAFTMSEDVGVQVLQALRVPEAAVMKFDASLLSQPTTLPFLIKDKHVSATPGTLPPSFVAHHLPACLPFCPLLHDFEDHLDDLELDWLQNDGVKRALEGECRLVRDE